MDSDVLLLIGIRVCVSVGANLEGIFLGKRLVIFLQNCDIDLFGTCPPTLEHNSLPVDLNVPERSRALCEAALILIMAPVFSDRCALIVCFESLFLNVVFF